jgi:hypothetical protein
MSNYFKQEMKPFLDKKEFEKAKESLREIPQGAAKILLFREILIREGVA